MSLTIAFIYPIKTQIMIFKTPRFLLLMSFVVLLTACDSANRGKSEFEIAQTDRDSTKTDSIKPKPSPKKPNFEDEDWGDEELFDEDEVRKMMKKAKRMKEIMEDEFFENDEPDVQLKAKIDCHPDSVSNDLIENIKVAITKEHMDDAKLLKAKVLVNEVCLLSTHVRDIAEIFMLDEAKLAFAKFAFGRTADPENYRKVAEAFTFKDSKRKLQTYVVENLKEEVTPN